MSFLLCFIILLAAASDAGKPCQKRRYDRNSFVCVCSGQQCDSPDPVGEFNADQLVYYVSDVNTYRLARNVAEKETQSEDVPMLKVSIDASQQFQRIFGFGGAFTDAAGINLNTLSKASRKLLLQQYFDPKDGIGYTVGRVPIASCDFSTSAYSYLDTPNDFNLSTFQLAKEDLEAKIPHILAANEMTNNQLRLFGSPWSAPGWMKTTGKMKGGGQLKPPFNGQYYETYAHYYRRFIEEYAKRNVSFWGLTIENEPGAGAVPLWSWQAMFLSNQMQRDFAHQLLSPILKQSEASKNVKIMGHDDQRSGILEAAKEMYADPAKASAIDGLASHWYSHSAYDVLQKAHAVRPDKFILATEACTGYLPTQHKPNLGDWSRGVEYGHDILNNLRNWVVGWTDWNLCLDLQGGPNWVQNFVDAPIIVNATADEFYKQPMFYFLAHFSHFVPRDSVVISSSLIAPNGTTFADRPWEPRNVRPFLTRDEYFMNSKTNNQWSANPVEHVAFRTPDGNRVLVIINANRVQSHRVQVGEASDPQRNWILDIAPYSIYTAIWQKKT